VEADLIIKHKSLVCFDHAGWLGTYGDYYAVFAECFTNGLVFTEANLAELASSSAFVDRVRFGRTGTALREALVVLVRRATVSVTFEADAELVSTWKSEETIYFFDDHPVWAVQARNVSWEVDAIDRDRTGEAVNRDVLKVRHAIVVLVEEVVVANNPFWKCFSTERRFRTAVKAGNASYGRTFVFFVNDAVTVTVRTTVGASWASFCWTSVVAVSDTITVSVRTTHQGCETSFSRTFVVFVSNAVTVTVRTAIKGCKTCFSRTVVVAISNTVTVAVRATSEVC
jgi:hypothetical protein